MKIAVLREAAAGETRAALMPESVRALVAQTAEVHIESGTGAQAGASDADYVAAGGKIVNERVAAIENADGLCWGNRLLEKVLEGLKSDAILIGFLRPLMNRMP